MESANLDLEENKEIASKFERALGMGATLAELHGITPDTLEGVYAYAYNFYEKRAQLRQVFLFHKSYK
ncbi:CesD/SycD/LcrH family type III secretion system chaperone, partial [Escherichia coli]|nr:CesD/SycD/LcrH family type III secretion system chaperone [Escherichia coli]